MRAPDSCVALLRRAISEGAVATSLDTAEDCFVKTGEPVGFAALVASATLEQTGEATFARSC